MRKKSQIFNKLIALLFLFSFLASQMAVAVHTHYTSPATPHAKTFKPTSLADKCGICDLKNHNHFHAADKVFQPFAIVNLVSYADYTETYAGIKLVKSSSRSPPRA